MLVVGAGVHGLSTAWHLASQGERVLVLDKTGVAAGASGIACGVIRNNYFQPAMSDLMAACVEIWESDPEAFHYHGSGYFALGPPAQESDLTEVYARQQRIGYPSELYLGEEDVTAHMRSLYPDWRAPGITVCLHERAGGYAFNRESMFGLADKARAAGAEILAGVEVTGFEFDGSHAVTAVQTTEGAIEVEQVVVAVGPWIASLWQMLGLPDHLDVRQPDGTVVENQPMWTYWYLQEGEVVVDPASFVTADGRSSAVIHVDSDQPLRDDDGRLITDKPVGHLLQARPLERPGRRRPDPARPRRSRSIRIRPGASMPASRTCGARRCRIASSGSAARARLYRQVRSGGVGAFTADNFPVFDYMRPNVYVAADSNHGYKMIAVGREISRVLRGEHSALLHPFRYERFSQRRAASGLAQPVPLELNPAGTRRRRPTARRDRRRLCGVE